jgi:hypothetical protein
MRPSCLTILFLALFSTAAVAWDDPSAAVAATYRPADKKLLASSFVSAVNNWLHRYEHTLISQTPEHVRMQVRYDYVYDLELTVKDDRFLITVTGSERARNTANGKRNATNLAAGLLKRMEMKKSKRNEYEERWGGSR